MNHLLLIRNLKLEDILPWLAETVKVEGVLKPVYNYKIAE